MRGPSKLTLFIYSVGLLNESADEKQAMILLKNPHWLPTFQDLVQRQKALSKKKLTKPTTYTLFVMSLIYLT